jgi:rare lipoprotein A
MIQKDFYKILSLFLFAGLLYSQENPLPKFFFSQIGEASYYGNEFNNRKTSNGEIYNKNEFTAAHPFLAFGTSLKVTNLKNNKTSIVRINDRGPHKKGRIIDLSYAAAVQLEVIKHGTAKVKIETLAEPQEDKLDEVILYDDVILKGEEYFVQYKNPADSTEINKIISDDGRLKISLFKHKKRSEEDLSLKNINESEKSKIKHENNIPKNEFSVQAGAFINFDNADELKQSLMVLKYTNVEVQSLKEKNGVMYKVLVGNCKTREEANTIKNKLLKDNIIGFIITKGN